MLPASIERRLQHLECVVSRIESELSMNCFNNSLITYLLGDIKTTADDLRVIIESELPEKE